MILGKKKKNMILGKQIVSYSFVL